MVLRSVALAGKYCLLSRTGTRAETPVAESNAAALLSIMVPPIMLMVAEGGKSTQAMKRPQRLIYTLLLHTLKVVAAYRILIYAPTMT